MSCTDFHLRHLIKRAAEQRSHELLDDAFAIIQENYASFIELFSPELLVFFAEVATDLCEREDAVIRTLELYDRLACEDDQFKVRSLLIRCQYEARLGSECFKLKGLHLLQQIQFALSFLMKGLTIATRLSDRYGFLIYNASLVFWTVIRPICRMGWQKHIVAETNDVLEKLKSVAVGAGGKGGGKGGGPLLIPTTVDTTWVVELILNYAFGLEDLGKDDEAKKQVEEAYRQYEDMLKQNPGAEANDPQFRLLILNARAHFARKQAAAQGPVRSDIDKLRGNSLMGVALLVRNGGIPKETCEDELIKAWNSVDTEFNLVEAKDALSKGMTKDQIDERGANLEPQKLVDMSMALRAACAAECWPLARAMLMRLEKSKIPPGRGRILVDLSKSEIEVWQAKNLREEDPTSKMFLTPEDQKKVEVQARTRGCRLCEQCIMAAKRIQEIDLVEDSGITLWNIAREMLFDSQRLVVHKSLHKCVEILDEIQPPRLARLRVQLHSEVARCEISQDLLTKGCSELNNALSIDYTVAQDDLSDVIKQRLVVNEDGVGQDPAPYTRRFDATVDQQAHLLKWKLSLYEEPSDPADQVMLLLDQVRQQSTRKQSNTASVTFNLLARGFNELETALEGLVPEELEKLSRTFVPPPRNINSDAAMQPLPHQAPATVKDPDSDTAARVQDRRPRSEYEDAVVRIKRIIMLICRISIEAYKVEQYEFAIKAARRALGLVEGDIQFGPPPIEVDGALLLAEAAYTKALCLSKELEDFGVINGIDEEIPTEKTTEDVAGDIGESLEPELTPDEQASVNAKKRELIEALHFGMEKSHEFRQYWLVSNGLAHWWNLHLELVELSHGQPEYLKRTLNEYRDGCRKLLKYFYGEAALPDSDFDHSLVANLTLAHVNASVCAAPAHVQLDALDIDKLLVLKRLGGNERKELITRVTELCKMKDKPVKPEDLVKIKLDRLEAATTGAPQAKAKAAPKAETAPPEDRSDLQGREAEVMTLVASLPYSKDHEEGKKIVDQAVAVLNAWEPKQKDEVQLTLWIELWTRLGRQCLGKPLNPNIGSKYALMCGIKGLGAVDAPTPKHASMERLRWRGACHSLCGEVFVRLVDPQKQEKESVLKLRSMSVEQFERCCQYAIDTKSSSLAIFGAKSLWNVSLPLQHSAETRQTLLKPLLTATRALAATRYQEDPYFFVGLYSALFDCYSDTMQWDAILGMLGEAFSAVPAVCHRRLWALRMLALSKQGKNVVIAMGKMKESKAKAQAGIWLVLARSSSKKLDQLDAYMNAARILQEAQQTDVVEVRMELADWMLRNGFDQKIAQEQLMAGAEVLLEIEEDLEEEDEDDVDGFGDGTASSYVSERDQSDKHSIVSFRSKRSSRHGGSDAGSSRRRAKGSGSLNKTRTASKSSSRGSDLKKRRTSKSSHKSSKSATSRSSKQQKAEEDQELPDQLYSNNCEALVRIYAASSKLCTGVDAHSALLGAAHFAVRFFTVTVEIANKAAQDLANLQATAESADPLRSKTVSQGLGKLGATSGGKDQNKISVPIVPPFSAPQQLADWADPLVWPWQPNPALIEILSSAAKQEVLDGETCTWAGHADVFEKPPLSFHALCRLENDLEEHGYHLWAFPVLALHLQLAESFTSPIRDAMTCLVYMRLSRFASECRLVKVAGIAAAKGREKLDQMKDTLGSFTEELELVHSQRTGRGVGESLDPDFLESGGSAHKVCAPWSCNELTIYEVWAEVSQECLWHGELWMACKFSEEAAHHARVYGDRRTLRKIQITRARLASHEGKHEDAAACLTDVTAADLEQTVQVAQILASVYAAKRQPLLMDEMFDGAQNVIKESAKVAAGSETMASFMRAECEVHASQVLAEVSRLNVLSVTSRDWLETLDRVFTLQQNLLDKLSECSSHRRCIIVYLAFADAISKLLERKRQELACDAALSTANGGFLNCRLLANYAGCLCDLGSRCRYSRDALLSTTVPIEGVRDCALSPSELLAAKLDIWEARVGSMQREFEAAAKIEEGQKSLVVEVAKMSKADHASLTDLCTGRALQVLRAWPEEDTGIDPVEQYVTQWETEQDRQIAESKRVETIARTATSVEKAIIVVSNAVTTLQSVLKEGSDDGPEVMPTACEIEALVELGRLQLERAKNMPIGTNLVPVGTPSKWEQPSLDPRELRGLELGERYSNILQSKDPNDLYKVPVETMSSDIAADPSMEESDENTLFEEMGKVTLCEALGKALKTRHLFAARRALQALALDAYGAQCPEATFEFLAWLQSVDVCIRAEEVLNELVTDDHQERVQMGVLRRLEETWFDPTQLHAYESTIKRLGRESPFFQRLRLTDLPSINELLLTYFPPLTLVVTLQVHGDFLYVGAASTPEEGDPEKRLSQIQRMVTRMPVLASELHAVLLKLGELNKAIEKELVNEPGLNEEFSKQFDWLLSHFDDWIAKPIVKELTSSFWPCTTNVEHPSNPKQLVLLPDSTLWGFPLERCSSIANLFSKMCHSALSRDISLHVAAQRVRNFVEPADGSARIPLKASVAGFRLDSTSLLTDPFSEDSDDPKIETMSMLHDRLVQSKVVGNRSIHGKTLRVSPQDMKGMLTDSTAFISFGFSRFFVTMPARHLASQDLRRLSLFCLFNRSINDPSFRRQTKIDSAKTLRQMAAESPYGMSLMASFRGVQTIVMLSAPVPVPLAMRNTEIFTRALHGGKTVGKALEDLLSQQIKDPTLRYLRAKEGGELPPEARTISTQQVDPKDAKKHVESKHSEEHGQEAYLLPLHTQAAYSIIGAPWLFGETGPEGGTKGKK